MEGELAAFGHTYILPVRPPVNGTSVRVGTGQLGVPETPLRLFETAARLDQTGESRAAVIAALQADGASDLDLVRVVMRTYSVGHGKARQLLADAGLHRFVQPLTVVLPEDKPLL